MTTRIVWRNRRKRYTSSAAKSRKQDQGFTVDPQAAGGQHMLRPEENNQARVQFAEEEEAQPKVQFQEEEEEAQPKVQFQEEEEEEMQPKVQLQEEVEEAQPKVQLQEEEEEEMQPKIQFQEEEEEEEKEAAQPKPEPVPTRSRRLIRSVVSGGFKGSPGSLPFGQRIQASFGHHDVSNVKAFGDASAKKANLRLGSLAYASREKVAFRGYPDLHTAAHEAAHIVQQRQGVQLKDGTGRKGDSYECHADAVADKVVRGKSAESLLSRTPKHDQGGKD